MFPGVRVTDFELSTDETQSEDPVVISGWSHSWGGDDADFFNALWISGDDIYCTGATMSWGSGWSDGLLCRLNSDGVPRWTSVWGGNYVEYLVDVTVDPAGNPCVGGYTKSYTSGGGEDLLVVKYNSAGNVVWARTWGRALDDWAHALVSTPGGSIIAAGETPNEQYSSMSDLVFISYAGDGSLQWAKTYNSGSDDNNPFIDIDADGNIIATGRSTCGISGVNGSIIRLSADGELLSQYSWGGGHQDAFYRQTCDSAGNMYVSGYTISWGAGEEDALLVKFTPEGEIAWARSWGTAEPEISDSVHIGDDGLIYVCGLRIQNSNDYYSLLLRFTPDGDLVGTQQLATSGTTKLWDGHSLDGSNFVMVGSTRDAYGTWEPITGSIDYPDAVLLAMDGEFADAGGVHGEPEGVVVTPDNAVNDTGGGSLDCLAVSYRTN